MRVSHGTWGEWSTIRLESAAASVEVVAEMGARVVSLRDLAREREWLLQSEPPDEAEGQAWSTEDAIFGGRESFGWDECLPTVSICPDPLDPAGPPLRDHGDQWARGTYLAVDEARGSVTHTWSAPRWSYRLSRRLSFENADRLLAEYELVSLTERAQPLLWSQHPVFHLEPGSRIELPGVAEVLRTSQAGIDLPARCPWPLATPTGAGQPVDLSVVHTDLGWSAKLYADSPPGTATAVAPGRCPSRHRLGPRLRADAGHLALLRELAAWRPARRAGGPGAHDLRPRRPGRGTGRRPGAHPPRGGAPVLVGQDGAHVTPARTQARPSGRCDHATGPSGPSRSGALA